MGKDGKGIIGEVPKLHKLVEYDHVSEVAVWIKGMGKVLLLGVSYEEFLSKVLEAKAAGLNLVDTETFIWAGSSMQLQHHYRVTLNIDEIVAIDEVTKDMWETHVDGAKEMRTQQTLRGMQPHPAG